MLRLDAGHVVPVSSPPIAGGAVVVANGEIVAVGRSADLAHRFPGAQAIDLGSAVLAPGFVDTHCHVEWSLTGGMVSGACFADWMAAILEVGRRMTPQDFAAAADLGAVRALLGGTTTMADSGPTGAGAGALTRTGQRGVVHLEVFGREQGDDARRVADDTAQRVGAIEADAGPLVRVGVSPHAPYTVGPDLWSALLAHPDLATRPWTTHLAESPDETQLLASGDGPLAELFARGGREPGRWPGEGSPVARLATAGVLRPGLVAAHCVQLDADDIPRLSAAGVGVAHCPLSNQTLGCGTAPIPALRAAGIAVGLGTDSPASAGDFHLRADAVTAGQLHGPGLDETALLELMTIEGARVLGLADLIGSVEPGKRADLIAVFPGRPDQDPVSTLLDPSAQVTTVLVDGEVLVDAGRPVRVDPLQVLAQATEARDRLTA